MLSCPYFSIIGALLRLVQAQPTIRKRSISFYNSLKPTMRRKPGFFDYARASGTAPNKIDRRERIGRSPVDRRGAS